MSGTPITDRAGTAKPYSTGGSERTNGLTCFRVCKTQTRLLEIDLGPSQTRDLVAAAAGQSPKPHDGNRFRVGALGFHSIECGAESLHLVQHQEPIALAIRWLLDRRAGVGEHEFLPHGERKHGREVAHALDRRAGTSLDDDADAGASLLILGCLAGLHIAHELLDIGHANLCDLPAAKQRHDMML